MPYFRVAIEGSWPAAGEVFSTGFAVYCPPPNDLTQSDMNLWAEAMYDYWDASPAEVQQAEASIGSTGQVDRFRITRYASPGQPATAIAVSNGVPIVGSGAITSPPQCARVWSLLTGIPGRSYRGRMYWPKVTGALGSSFRDASVNQSMAFNVAAILSNLAECSVAGSDFQPAVASVTLGEVTPVTQVRIGDVVDTQRRRRDALVENYFTSPV